MDAETGRMGTKRGRGAPCIAAAPTRKSGEPLRCKTLLVMGCDSPMPILSSISRAGSWLRSSLGKENPLIINLSSHAWVSPADSCD